jgi:hypothetical protein
MRHRGDAIRTGKTDPLVDGMTKFWRNCTRVGRLEAVFSQQVIHHRRHEKPRAEKRKRSICVGEARQKALPTQAREESDRIKWHQHKWEEC